MKKILLMLIQQRSDMQCALQECSIGRAYSIIQALESNRKLIESVINKNDQDQDQDEDIDYYLDMGCDEHD